MSKTEKSDELLAVEAEHGFTFGTPKDYDTAAAPRGTAVSCSTPTCKAQNRMVQLHTDTVLPVLCGECGTVLHCPHEDTLDSVIFGGTMGAPIKTTNTRCLLCQSIILSVTVNLPPVRLEDVPIADVPNAAAIVAAR